MLPHTPPLLMHHHLVSKMSIDTIHGRGIPSEKIGQNIHPLESRFFVINYQHWTSTSAFWPILAPLDHWGGLGGLGGDLGGPADPKNDIIARGPF